MQIFWSNDQLKHTGARFLKEGYLIDSPESPCRAQLIFNQLSEMDFIIDPPADFGLDPILRVHPAQYIDFCGTFMRNGLLNLVMILFFYQILWPQQTRHMCQRV